ncbi:hypothetical protein P7H20_11025 [Paenibacillus larvae]|nr:hypothetical protein [Paenibacillus larvae]MDT2275271.1 hypothetical protein [Paenibacillus larvae]
MRMKKLRSIALTAALVSSLAVGGAASANTADLFRQRVCYS